MRLYAYCPMCSQVEETGNHLLIWCPFASKVWMYCYRWLEWNIVHPSCCKAHLLQHTNPSLSSQQNAGFRIIQFAIAWSLWLHRNRVVFNGRVVQEKLQLLEEAQIRAWNWLSVKLKGFHISVYEWRSHPNLCLMAAGQLGARSCVEFLVGFQAFACESSWLGEGVVWVCEGGAVMQFPGSEKDSDVLNVGLCFVSCVFPCFLVFVLCFLFVPLLLCNCTIGTPMTHPKITTR